MVPLTGENRVLTSWGLAGLAEPRSPGLTALLARCAQAVGADGRILIVEGVLVRDGHRSLINMLDLEMLVLCGPGHERTKPELRRLFSGAGLELVASQPLTGTGRLFVTRPRTRLT